ncbi:ribitol 5-phosphate transferase FKRP [Brevipalpus obovatus]|uniref:ribitol 5-phosphate transferase FKRP n=1 Tax=Brevipalpus obovatus TaxID=246614 RepID=UPI003D9DBA5F
MITNECEQVFSLYPPAFARKPKTLVEQLTVIIVDFEPGSTHLMATVATFCKHYPFIKLVIISETILYPPLKLSTKCNVHVLTTHSDPRKKWLDSDPLKHINSEYVMVIPDSVIFDKGTRLEHIQFSRIEEKDIVLVSLITNPQLIIHTCIAIDWDIRHWTLKFRRKETYDQCDFHDGDFAYLMKRKILEQLNIPFASPFPESFAIQAVFKGLKMIIEDDLKFFTMKIAGVDQHELLKAESLKKWKLSQLYHRFKVKKVIESDGSEHFYGCTKETPRCFSSIVNNTPEYLYWHRWTPPCCLENLRTTARRVFSVFEQCEIRYWLEGGSLLGAARYGDIIPWDFDVDLGIYEEDIAKCPILSYARKQPVKDDEGFIWEKAVEGDFLRVQFSEINRLHVDIFPFYAVDGMMTKRTWFKDHPQDKEFPEFFVKKLKKIPFVGVQASAPTNVTQFLEYKFDEEFPDLK